MPTITAFKPQKNQKRVNIYIDGEFGFGLDLENFLKLGLKLNQELTTLEIEEIIKKAEFQKTFDKLLRFVIVRPRSEKEIKDYLKRKKVHESLNEELFNRLNRLIKSQRN
ncbi:MAG: Regulatory protein RecX [Candidatus Woesebacteria bacterium GW2011_GWC1_30_29]|nr:MAG: Regulatory protein RecX [Candidatus Woesebacteria bacterium GW2011_GWC1_30_29]